MLGLQDWLPPASFDFIHVLPVEFETAPSLHDLDKPWFWVSLNQLLNSLDFVSERKHQNKIWRWLREKEDRHLLLKNFWETRNREIENAKDQLYLTHPGVIMFFMAQEDVNKAQQASQKAAWIEIIPRSVIEKSSQFLNLETQITKRCYAFFVANHALIQFAQYGLWQNWLDLKAGTIVASAAVFQEWSIPFQPTDALLERACIHFRGDVITFKGFAHDYYPWLEVLRGLHSFKEIISMILLSLPVPQVLQALIINYAFDQSFFLPHNSAGLQKSVAISLASFDQFIRQCKIKGEMLVYQPEMQKQMRFHRVAYLLERKEFSFSSEEEFTLTQSMLLETEKEAQTKLLESTTVKKLCETYRLSVENVRVELENQWKFIVCCNGNSRVESVSYNKVEPQHAFIYRLRNADSCLCEALLRHAYCSKLKKESALTVEDLVQFRANLKTTHSWYTVLNDVYIQHRLKWGEMKWGEIKYKTSLILQIQKEKRLQQWMDKILCLQELKKEKNLHLLVDGVIKVFTPLDTLLPQWKVSSLIFHYQGESVEMRITKTPCGFTLTNSSNKATIVLIENNKCFTQFSLGFSKKSAEKRKHV